MKIRFLIVILGFVINTIHAQTTNITGVVNTYTSVVSIDPCYNNQLDVSSVVGFSVGDRVMIIQMQGLVINESNTASFGTFIPANDTSTGYYEIADISAISGTTISFTNDIMNTYNPTKNTQLVRIPQYVNANVTGVLSPLAWNGSIGGVLAIEVSGTLTLGANISGDGKGFRGGMKLAAISNPCGFLTSITDYATDTLTWQYKSFKGEGVATYVANKWGSRAPQANGGGGGNDHNSGGGGGANKANGGIGGRNNEPSVLGCKGYQPGMAGLSLNTLSGDRIFMGGGGGSGHENNSVNFAGGNGGAIIYIKSSIINGAGKFITARGDSSRRSGQDGGGGGGAGGTIILEVGSITGNLTVSANGGRGGTTDQGNSNRCFGPGGGGSGGEIYTTLSSIPVGVTLQASGGAPGIVYRSTNACNGSSNSASSGINGASLLSVNPSPKSTKAATNCIPLPVTWLTFNVSQVEHNAYIDWSTASEINNDYFEILKSSDGFHYEVIGTINGMGNSTQINHYQFIDAHPNNGVNYYKIKQVDFDKQFDYSKIAYLYFGLNWHTDDIIIYPNPMDEHTEQIHVIFPSTDLEVEVQLYDLLGNVLLKEPISKESAYNGDFVFSLKNQVFGNTIIMKLVSETGEVFMKKLSYQK